MYPHICRQPESSSSATGVSRALHASCALCIRVEHGGYPYALPGLLSLQLPILLFLPRVVLASTWPQYRRLPSAQPGTRFSRRGSGDLLEVVFKCSLCQSVCRFCCGPANHLPLLLAKGCTGSGSPQPQRSSATRTRPCLDSTWPDRLCMAEPSLLVLRPGSEHWTCGSEQQCDRCFLL